MSGIGSLSASDVVAFAAREGNKMIEAQVNLKAKTFAALDKMPMKGRRAVINVVNGGLPSTSQVVDFGALPSEAANVPAQGFVDAVGYVSRLGLGRIALETLAGVDDSADLLDLQLQIAADDMARQIGRAVFGQQLAAPTVAGSTVTQAGGAGTVVEIVAQFTGGLSDWREGEAYDYETDFTAGPPAGNQLNFKVLCTNVEIVSDNVVEVTMIVGPGGVPGFASGTYADALMASPAGLAGTLQADDAFFLRGSRVNGDALTGVPPTTSGLCESSNASAVDLTVITSPTLALHGLSAGQNGWTGITFSGVGVPTPELFMGRSRILQARGGVAPTHLVLSGLASVNYAASQIANASLGGSFAGTSVAGQTQPRRSVDGKLDKYGKDGDSESGLVMFGRPVVIDDNCPTTAAFLINKDYLKVGEWKKLSAEDEGGSPLLLSRTTFSKEVQFSAIYNLVCRKRNAHAQLAGVNPI